MTCGRDNPGEGLRSKRQTLRAYGPCFITGTTRGGVHLTSLCCAQQYNQALHWPADDQFRCDRSPPRPLTRPRVVRARCGRLHPAPQTLAAQWPNI